MKKFVLYLSVPLFMIACNSGSSESTAVPAAPASAEAAAQLVKGKTYETKKVALLSPFSMDAANPYTWMNDMKDTTKFFKDYLAARMAFSMQFVNDTTVVLQEEKGPVTGTYKFDNEKGDDEKDGIKLRISYTDNTMNFPGATEPTVMTYTYFVAGADGKSLLLEMPRSYNNRKVAALLQPK